MTYLYVKPKPCPMDVNAFSTFVDSLEKPMRDAIKSMGKEQREQYNAVMNSKEAIDKQNELKDKLNDLKKAVGRM